MNTSIRKSLGSLGVITNGTVRDIDEVEKVGFALFASGLQVSHGHAHLEDFNVPVMLFGMRVSPGDLIHADKHGAVVIPREIAHEAAAACRRVELNEKPMLAALQAPGPGRGSRQAHTRRNTKTSSKCEQTFVQASPQGRSDDLFHGRALLQEDERQLLQLSQPHLRGCTRSSMYAKLTSD
ncbi:MAG TPA: RraA family protein [Bryobacteraceae bacterium]|nr:RraA family protein [Bryobacteraceae bacterium]